MEVKEEPAEIFLHAEAVAVNFHGGLIKRENIKVDNSSMKYEIAGNIQESDDYNLMEIKPEELDIKEENLSITIRAGVDHEEVNSLENMFSCDICGQKYSWKQNLIRHKKTHLKVHEMKEKPYACNVCKYRTACKQHFKRHMKTHMQKKPNVCSVCAYRTLHEGYLKRHMKIHTSEESYACHVCAYRTLRKAHWIQHMKTHIGEKSFSCSVCAHRTSCEEYLKRHMKIHTSEKS